MRIPVFVSCPTELSKTQKDIKELIFKELEKYKLEPRTLGQSDYPIDLPLREVFVLAKHCAGALVLGFKRFIANEGVTEVFVYKMPSLPLNENMKQQLLSIFLRWQGEVRKFYYKR